MKKQEYMKPETTAVEMDSCTILAGSTEGGVSQDGGSIDLDGDIDTDGDAGTARMPQYHSIWDD